MRDFFLIRVHRDGDHLTIHHRIDRLARARENQPRQRKDPQKMKAMIDDEHVVDVGDGLGQRADDLDRLLHGCAFEHRRIFRLHQAARRVGGIAQELLDPCGQGPGRPARIL